MTPLAGARFGRLPQHVRVRRDLLNGQQGFAPPGDPSSQILPSSIRASSKADTCRD
jgi:hypothetical protein